MSSRHDPMDAIEEALHDGAFDEIVISTLPRGVSHWLQLDLPARLMHDYDLPVTVVTAKGRPGSREAADEAPAGVTAE